MPNWSDLPTEIKEMVVNEVDSEGFDLVDLRSTNRENKFLCEQRFTERYFSVRKVFVREKSLKMLVEISKDPVFGPCVETVLLSALHGDYEIPRPDLWDSEERRPKYPWYHLTCFEDEPQEFQPLLVEAFRNFKSYRSSLNIGLERFWGPKEDEDDRCNQGLYGWLEWETWGEPGYTARYAKWVHVAENERNTFKMLASAVQEAKLCVRSLRVSLFDHYMHYVAPNPDDYVCSVEDYKEPCNIELVKDVFHYLTNSPKTDVDIDLSTGHYRPDGYRNMKVSYQKSSNTLTIKEVDTWDAQEFIQPWLSTLQVRWLRLVDIGIETAHYFTDLIEHHKHSLRKLRIKNCGLSCNYTCSLVLNSVSTMAALEYFTIVNKRSSTLLKLLAADDIDHRVRYMGNVAEQVTEKLQIWEEMDHSDSEDSSIGWDAEDYGKEENIVEEESEEDEDELETDEEESDEDDEQQFENDEDKSDQAFDGEEVIEEGNGENVSEEHKGEDGD